ncbi:MAG: prepilin-type N-terminal cleavage/methylation domain-containing protein [bacterium]
MKKMRGFTLIELLIVVAIIAILAAIAVPNFLEAQIRSKVSRVKADHRSLATGLESYYVDNNLYPAWDCGLRGANAFAGATSGARKIHTFRIKTSATDPLLTLTTPTAYITNYFPDPFANTKGSTFGYYADTAGWILYSYGPDTDEGVTQTANSPGDLAKGLPVGCTTVGAASILAAQYNTSPESAYSSSVSQPSPTLIAGPSSNDAFTYDPTNGTVSPGDVWRVKQ